MVCPGTVLSVGWASLAVAFPSHRRGIEGKGKESKANEAKTTFFDGPHPFDYSLDNDTTIYRWVQHLYPTPSASGGF